MHAVKIKKQLVTVFTIVPSRIHFLYNPVCLLLVVVVRGYFFRFQADATIYIIYSYMFICRKLHEPTNQRSSIHRCIEIGLDVCGDPISSIILFSGDGSLVISDSIG